MAANTLSIGKKVKQRKVGGNSPKLWQKNAFTLDKCYWISGVWFLVSEAGSQCTWASNSSENRLTPWSNDPVRDTTGEALYLRDEETGEIWTPTPLPAGSNQPYRVKHGAGYTIFEHNSHGLRHVLTFLPALKILLK